MSVKSVSVVIVDDEAPARDYMKGLLSSYDFISVIAEASSVKEALAIINKHHPDIVFLDVEMPQQNGFDMLHNLDKNAVHPVIIFVTAYEHYAIEAIKHAAFDYLLKPVDPGELKKAIQRYQQHRPDSTSVHEKINLLFQTLTSYQKLPFNIRSGTIFIDPKDILYCKAEGNYTSIVMTGKREEFVTSQIGSLMNRLPADMFLRIGRSLIINRGRLNRINRNRQAIIFEDDELPFELKISSRLIREVSRKLL
ncbi:MAG: response regulator transcription factor [Bacteroidales bacterium]|nr:response regulator transcription factor [Bacteroidales bacterium]MBN2763329.1 response regulator transcription factor [Bacteroidales bacterium]